MQLIFGEEGSGEDEMEVELEDERWTNLVGLPTSFIESRQNIGKKKVLVVRPPMTVLGWSCTC